MANNCNQKQSNTETNIKLDEVKLAQNFYMLKLKSDDLAELIDCQVHKFCKQSSIDIKTDPNRKHCYQKQVCKIVTIAMTNIEKAHDEQRGTQDMKVFVSV